MSGAVPNRVGGGGEDEGELVARVCAIVATSLGCELSRVRPTASLMGELGAESLDFLDIVFELERAFDIQITRGELERAARGDMTEEEFAPGGAISVAGLARLRELLPEAAERVVPGLRPVQILGLFSVQTLVNMVRAKQCGLSTVAGAATA